MTQSLLAGSKDTKIKHERVIDIKDLTKHFVVGRNTIKALQGINFSIEATDFVVIYGPSGCGKSTLLNIISGLDNPTSGKVLVRNQNIFSLDDDTRGKFRSKKMGIVHQIPYWIKALSVKENIALPLIIDGINYKSAYKRALQVLNELNISGLANQLPTQLSGGEQQRAGIARALISNPWIILADEPTGNLDSTAADEIMALFDMLNRRYRRTIVLVTHNQSYWSIGNRQVGMKDGRIVKGGG